MLKKTITYENFDGEEVTQDFYFNMTKAEVLDFVAGLPGYDVEAYLKNLAVSNDKRALLDLLKDLIARSYGELVEGRFLKKPDNTNAFLVSEAYSELLFSMAENLDVATSFFNSIMPKSLMKDISPDELKKQAEAMIAKQKPADIPTTLESVTNADDPESQLAEKLKRLEELEAKFNKRQGE